MTLNDVELNEHCLKARQASEALARLMREGKIGLLWVALYDMHSHTKEAMSRLLEINKEPVYLDVNKRR